VTKYFPGLVSGLVLKTALPRAQGRSPHTAAESIFAGFQKEQTNFCSPQETATINLMLIASTCQSSSANTLVLL